MLWHVPGSDGSGAAPVTTVAGDYGGSSPIAPMSYWETLPSPE